MLVIVKNIGIFNIVHIIEIIKGHYRNLIQSKQNRNEQQQKILTFKIVYLLNLIGSAIFKLLNK